MAHTELIFPPRLIPLLAPLRSRQWQVLVERVRQMPVGTPERRAFILLMVRLAGCVTCKSESWRAQQGCEMCAKQVVKRFRGADEDLVALYEACLVELRESASAEVGAPAIEHP